jgi:hypothetical protein
MQKAIFIQQVSFLHREDTRFEQSVKNVLGAESLQKAPYTSTRMANSLPYIYFPDCGLVEKHKRG